MLCIPYCVVDPTSLSRNEESSFDGSASESDVENDDSMDQDDDNGVRDGDSPDDSVYKVNMINQ